MLTQQLPPQPCSPPPFWAQTLKLEGGTGTELMLVLAHLIDVTLQVRESLGDMLKEGIAVAKAAAAKATATLTFQARDFARRT